MSIRFTGPNGMNEPITRQELYSDGTPMIKTLGWARIVEQADTIVVQPQNMMEFINAMFLVDAVEGAGGLIRRLVLPYVPGARQDRTNPTGDVLNTASSVGNMIRQRFAFSDVVILDPHSPAIVEAMGPKPIIYPLSEVVKQIPNKYDGVIAPDRGARDRAQMVATALNVPLFYGGKNRDVATGKLTGFVLEPLNFDTTRPNGHYLVADDICDGGGTFIGLAEKIREQGCTADLYVSHGIFAKGASHLIGPFQNIYTTDSLPQNSVRANVIPVVKDMEIY